MESFEINPIKTAEETHKDALLKKANTTLEELGLNARYKKLKETIEGCEVLKGKKIVMVDDLVNLMQLFAGDLTVATDGNASFILHTDQTENNLSKQIIDAHPDIVLMDKNLGNNLSGVDITRNLLNNNSSITVIGFSSESSAGKEFLSAGARGFVDKDTTDTVETIRNIAKII